MSDIQKLAKNALKRLHKAMDNGTGTYIHANEVQALAVTSIGERFEETEDE